MQNITYKFTIACQEPGHILLGMTTIAPMTLRPDVQAWSDCPLLVRPLCVGRRRVH